MNNQEMKAMPVSNGWAVATLGPLLGKDNPSVDEMIEALSAHPRFRAPFHDAIAKMAEHPEDQCGGHPVEGLVNGLATALTDPCFD